MGAGIAFQNMICCKVRESSRLILTRQYIVWPLLSDCKKTKLGTEYRGKVNKTVKGYDCQRWDTDSPHKVHTTRPVNAENYCRNPDNASKGPWCYVNSKKERYDYCPIPLCEGKLMINKLTIHFSKIRDIYTFRAPD